MNAETTFEDDTALSLIRRFGYPPQTTYHMMPEKHDCDCCKNLSEFENEHRQRSGTNSPTTSTNRRSPQWDLQHYPPPPATLREFHNDSESPELKLDRQRCTLIVAIHHGREFFSVSTKNDVRITLRYGKYKGSTGSVRGNIRPSWEEQFEFPMKDAISQSLEIFAVNATTNCVFGKITLPSIYIESNPNGAVETLGLLPVEPEVHRRQYGYTSKAVGALRLSWRILQTVEEAKPVKVAPPGGPSPRWPDSFSSVLMPFETSVSITIKGLSHIDRDILPYCRIQSAAGVEASTCSAQYPASVYEWDRSLVMVSKTNFMLLSVHNSLADANNDYLGGILLDLSKFAVHGSASVALKANDVLGSHVFPSSLSVDFVPAADVFFEWHLETLYERRGATLTLQLQQGMDLVTAGGHPLRAPFVSVATGELEAVTNALYSPNPEWDQEVIFLQYNHEHPVEFAVMEEESQEVISMAELRPSSDHGTVVLLLTCARESTTRCLGQMLISWKIEHHSNALIASPSPQRNIFASESPPTSQKSPSVDSESIGPKSPPKPIPLQRHESKEKTPSPVRGKASPQVSPSASPKSVQSPSPRKIESPVNVEVLQPLPQEEEHRGVVDPATVKLRIQEAREKRSMKEAALFIQNAARAKEARAQCLEKIEAKKSLKAKQSAMEARQREEESEKAESILLLQSAFRGQKARRRVHQFLNQRSEDVTPAPQVEEEHLMKYTPPHSVPRSIAADVQIAASDSPPSTAKTVSQVKFPISFVARRSPTSDSIHLTFGEKDRLRENIPLEVTGSQVDHLESRWVKDEYDDILRDAAEQELQAKGLFDEELGCKVSMRQPRFEGTNQDRGPWYPPGPPTNTLHVPQKLRRTNSNPTVKQTTATNLSTPPDLITMSAPDFNEYIRSHSTRSRSPAVRRQQLPASQSYKPPWYSSVGSHEPYLTYLFKKP